MEGKEAVKIEANTGPSSLPDYITSSFSLHEVLAHLSDRDRSSLGFMELLGVDNFTTSSLFDTLLAPSANTVSAPNPPKIDSSEGLTKLPSTPNSSSISSESSEAFNGQPTKEEDGDRGEDQQKTKKQLKVKKTNQKRQREPRFAFMTKSEVDHLEDGYRWRKYGQKAVKNSPFPRSYYRCTTASCHVKKRVERCFSDPSVVVTTYEGQHTHPSSLIMPPPSVASGQLNGAAAALGLQMQINQHLCHQQIQEQAPCVHSFLPMNFEDTGAIGSGFLQERRFCSPSGSVLLKDHGLLEDVFPSNYMVKERQMPGEF